MKKIIYICTVLLLMTTLITLSTIELRSKDSSNWQKTTKLNKALSQHVCLSYKDYIYVIGGKTSESSVSTPKTLYTKIDENGNIKKWNFTTQLPEGRSEHSGCINKNIIYIVGGIYKGKSQKTVYMNQIGGNGSLGAWERLPDLPETVANHSVYINNSYIYVITSSKNIYFAKLKKDGTLDGKEDYEWTKTIELPITLKNHNAIIVNNVLYIIGGDELIKISRYNDKPLHSKVFFSKIKDDGNLTEWKTSEEVPEKKFDHTSLVHNNMIYIVGGWNGNFISKQSKKEDFYNEIYSSKIKQDGTLTKWHKINKMNMPTGYVNHSSVICNGFIYVIGGYSISTKIDDYKNDVIFRNLK